MCQQYLSLSVIAFSSAYISTAPCKVTHKLIFYTCSVKTETGSNGWSNSSSNQSVWGNTANSQRWLGAGTFIYLFMYFYFMQSKSEKRASPKTQDGVCIFVLKTCWDKSDLHLSALKSGGQSSLFPTVKLMQQKSSIFSNQTASEEIGSNAVSHLIIVIINVRTIALEIYNYHDL